MRIYKQSGGIGVPSESFYFISAGGVMYSIEETQFHSNGNGNSTMERYNIPDLGYEDQNKEINYQIQDHLGNLRLSYTVLHCPSCSEQNCASVDVQYQINYIAEYLAYGGLLREFVRNGTAGEKFLSTGHERDKQTSWDYRQARYYDADLGRFLAVDPLAHLRGSHSPYNYCSNNSINRVDPDGKLDDWVREGNGNIKWDKDANDQATTKTGETYLGKTLTFIFNSYIDGKLWDGPLWKFPAGNKLTSTIMLTGNENAAGELIGLSAKKTIEVGTTPVGKARDFYPGLGSDQNKFGFSETQHKKGLLDFTTLNFEQHASVSPSEELGMRRMGYNIANVAQKLNINYSQGRLKIATYTDIFPSATLTVNGSQIMYYQQPSFKATHRLQITGWTTPNPHIDHSWPRPIYDYSYKPAEWYKR